MMSLEDVADLMLKRMFPGKQLKSVDTIDELIDRIKKGEMKGSSIMETDYLLSVLYEIREEIAENDKEICKESDE